MASHASTSSASEKRRRTYTTLETVQLIMDADNDDDNDLSDDSLEHEDSDSDFVADRNSRHIVQTLHQSVLRALSYTEKLLNISPVSTRYPFDNLKPTSCAYSVV